jgi:hypothetical protein
MIIFNATLFINLRVCLGFSQFLFLILTSPILYLGWTLSEPNTTLSISNVLGLGCAKSSS